MKFPLPLAFAFLLAACSTPETRVIDHQARLNDEARENFYREQAEHRRQMGITAPPPRQAVVQNAPQPTPKLRPFRGMRPPTPTPPLNTAKILPRPTPAAKPAKPAKPRRVIADDTIYEPTAAGRQELRAWELHQSEQYKAYEAREARRLGKRPDQLTREERLWIRESYQ